MAHFIVSQSSQEERKAAYACLLRAAMSCWNIGNFNGAMEITTGLRYVVPPPILRRVGPPSYICLPMTMMACKQTHKKYRKVPRITKSTRRIHKTLIFSRPIDHRLQGTPACLYSIQSLLGTAIRPRPTCIVHRDFHFPMVIYG